VTLIRAVSGFATFWYEFIVGDDWTSAATIAIALTATFLLLRARIDAWWLTPILVVGAVALGLARASRRSR
jgi:hypothetical protein